MKRPGVKHSLTHGWIWNSSELWWIVKEQEVKRAKLWAMILPMSQISAAVREASR
jgi:hypothetical protein